MTSRICGKYIICVLLTGKRQFDFKNYLDNGIIVIKVQSKIIQHNNNANLLLTKYKHNLE
jgi:hypothetical protein